MLMIGRVDFAAGASIFLGQSTRLVAGRKRRRSGLDPAGISRAHIDHCIVEGILSIPALRAAKMLADITFVDGVKQYVTCASEPLRLLTTLSWKSGSIVRIEDRQYVCFVLNSVRSHSLAGVYNEENHHDTG